MRQWGDSRPQSCAFRDNSQPLQPMHVGLLCSLWRHARSSYAVMSLRSPHLSKDEDSLEPEGQEMVNQA